MRGPMKIKDVCCHPKKDSLKNENSNKLSIRSQKYDDSKQNLTRKNFKILKNGIVKKNTTTVKVRKSDIKKIDGRKKLMVIDDDDFDPFEW